MTIDVFMADPTPTDTAEYRGWVARVAGFHEDVQKKKLQHMISQTLRTLEVSDDSKLDERLKGVCYALREMLLWGDEMVKKQVVFASGYDVTAEDT